MAVASNSNVLTKQMVIIQQATAESQDAVRQLYANVEQNLALAKHAETWECKEVIMKLTSIAKIPRRIWNAMRDWKAEVWAAVASAFAAFISIGAAVMALVISLHQEAISRDQLRATYLSNLYTKQVEGIGALERSFALFSRFAQEHGGLYCNADAADVFLRNYTSNLDAYNKLDADIRDLSAAISYVVPSELAEFIDYLKTVIELTLSNSKRFADSKSNNDDYYRQFCNENDTHRKELSRLRTELFWCVQPVFQQGKPISRELLAAECNIPKSR